MSEDKSNLYVGLIAAFAMIFGAALGNWQNIFPEKVSELTKFQYDPTSDIDTEIRIFLAYKNTNESIESIRQAMIVESIKRFEITFEEAELEVKAEVLGREEFEKIFLDVYKDNFTLAEIQALNSIHSTQAAQREAALAPKLSKEFFEKYVGRLERMETISDDR